MKKNINLMFGFTIAELLISLLITAIVAAAMVPVIGLKKIKSHHNRFGHGIAECYYENEGTPEEPEWKLKYYYADNNQRGSTLPVAVNGDYCTFTPPKADYFEIIAIGAGTDGAEGIPVFAADNLKENELTGGKIRIDRNFQNDITNAKIKDAQGKYINIGYLLRGLLNDWHNSDRNSELKVAYMIDSPIGAGGSATCKLLKSSNSECGNCTSPTAAGEGSQCSRILRKNLLSYENLLNKMNSENSCFGFIHASGGNSAQGYKTSSPVEFFLSGKTKIKTEESTSSAGVSVDLDGEKYIYLNAVAKGVDGSFQEANSFVPIAASAVNTSSGDIIVTNMNYSPVNLKTTRVNNGQTYGNELESSCSENVGFPTSGKLYYPIKNEDGTYNYTNTDSGVLVWKYSGMQVRPMSGYGGNPGNEKTVVYENLKKPIILRPAPYIPKTDENTENNELSYVREKPDDNKTTLVSASSGGGYGEYKEMPFTLINADMPIPRDPLRWAKPNNRNHFTYVDKINASPFNSGLKNCGNDCPGYAGIGTYFYMDQLPNANTLSITNLYNNAQYFIPTEKFIQEYAIDLSNKLCDDKVTEPISMSPITYQHVNNSGNPDDDEYGQAQFTPKYCREPKIKGSPGAIIIMW